MLASVLLLGACGGKLPITYHPDRENAELLEHGPDQVESRTIVTASEVYRWERCDSSCQLWAKINRLEDERRELRAKINRLETRLTQHKLKALKKNLLELSKQLRDLRAEVNQRPHKSAGGEQAQCGQLEQSDPQVREECRRQRKGK